MLNPTLFFLWRPVEITPAVVEMAHHTSTGAIFDISNHTTEDTAKALRASGATDIKIYAEYVVNWDLEGFLQDTGVTNVWVEYHSALVSCSHEAFIDRLHQLSARFNCIPITGDLALLSLILDSEESPRAVALKGAETAGFVSKETTGILYTTLREMSSQRGRCPEVLIWGAVATPEAAAAFLCSGAKGIVFESLHWQTDMVSADPNLKRRLSRLRHEHTALVGHALDVACRFHDKGNSLAVKELRQYADTQFSCDVTEDHRRAFARKVKEAVIPALESNLGRQDLVFMAPEAAFAQAFAQRFGHSTRQALPAFLAEVERICWEAPQKLGGFVENAAARTLGTRYPIIQGAMTWISDMPEFARAVSEAGGLPTLALGLKSRADLEKELDRLTEIMGKNPYAVNFIALPENPHLEEQLAWIEQLCPPFAVIAAGDPSHAGRLQKKGIQTIYLAASEALIRLALGAGVRFVVLEGNEAGGHVGEHSTLILAQIALELRRKEPELFRNCHVVLAGGIFNRETVFRALMLGAEAIQMGTAYLATKEIVATGALSPLYQRLVVDSRPGATALSGESIGLRVRSLKTPVMDAICNLEREWTSGRQDEISFRQGLEAMSANSLLVAARGVRQPYGSSLDEDDCMREGQFMSGAIAGAVNHIQSIAEFHRSLAEMPLELTLPEKTARSVPASPRLRMRREDGERIAITAMALVNSLGNAPKEIWEASMAGRSGIIEVPRSKWNHDLYYDPDPRARSKTYCNVGAFQNIAISRKELGIAPQDFRSMADSTRLTLWLAEQTIKESGLLDSGIPRERISVIISQNSGEAAGTITDLIFDVYSHDIVQYIRDFVPLTPELEAAVRDKIKAGRLTVDDTTLLGRLNCTAGGFVSNRYGLQGPSYSVSAACATSLVALYSAIQMIRNGIIDAAVVGGGEEPLKPSHYLEFSALKALAMLSGGQHLPHETCRPFDATRDGMVLGEGGGMIVIERESMAKRRGAPIHAYIRGIGASNNDQGMVESLAETQLIALQASFQDTGYGPDQVDLVECHATSTVQGDIEEIKAFKALFDGKKRMTLTSFKSQIGHTLGASGLNSLIRGVTAMNSGIFPSTPTYRTPDPQIDLESAGFHIPIQPVEWPQPDDRPRRVQVNAFGFGGANYVVQLEQCRETFGHVMVDVPLPEKPEPDRRAALEAQPSAPGVSFFVSRIGNRPYRLGVVGLNEAKSRAKVATLEPPESGDSLSEKALRVMARQGIFAAPADQPTLPLAFVFAGQGSQYIGMGKALYASFPEIRKWMDKVAEVADFDLLDLLFNSTEEDLQKTRWQQPALYTMELALVRNLMAMGVQPKAMAGHSLGELVALSAAEVFSYADGLRIVNKRAQCMDKASGLGGDPGTMVAVNAPMAYLEEKLSSTANVYFTNFNSPHQVVLGGDTEPMITLMEEIKNDGHKATQLKVSMAFHSPIMKVIREEMAAFVAEIAFHPPKIPVVSNTTMSPYPDSPEEIRDILMAHLESPVHWTQNVRALWHDFGIRHFVEIGPKDTLCSLVVETLDQALCFPTCAPEGEVPTYQAAVARLYALGHLPKADVTHLETGAPRSVPSSPSVIAPRVPVEDSVGAIVQREINNFVLESFGKIIKPQIVGAVRRELDPGFTQERLDGILGAASTVQPHRAQSPQSLATTTPHPLSKVEPQPRPAEPYTPEQDQTVVDYVEQVIQIIMDATGYERDEIEPDMDIRQDLAIRSSRLPVIMDDVERRFGITVYIEDFVGVSTVREIANRIEEVVGRTSSADAPEQRSDPSSGAVSTAAKPGEAAAEDAPQKPPLRRLVFENVELHPSAGNPLMLTPAQQVALLRVHPRSVLATDVSRLLERRFGTNFLHLDCFDGRFDLRTASGAQNAVMRLKETQSLAGLILVLEAESQPLLSGPEETTAFLSGFFGCLKLLMDSKNKAFSMSLLRGFQPGAPEVAAAEGILGMFLAAAHEYPSMLFRSVALDHRTEVKNALDFALDKGNPLIELIYHDQKAFSIKATPAPLSLTQSPDPVLGADDVVVISGGAKGVTFRIAQALAPFKPRIVLLGRTELDPAAAYDTLRNAGDPAAKKGKGFFKKKEIGPENDLSRSETSKHQAGLDIARSVSRLSTLGLKASYRCCDVSDPRQVSRALDQIAKQYGKIDGIIHGAGLIRDGFLEHMTPEDFKEVVEVKLLGAWNLYRAARDHGLRFFTALSSLVAIQGNVGQVNYCAANRAMAALVRAWPATNIDLVSKALMLPPIEGTGMAEDPEVKALMKLKGLASAFVHADELAQMFCHELFLAPPQPSWVSVARTFPRVKGTLVESMETTGDSTSDDLGELRFRPEDLPMIGTVDELDLKNGELVAKRVFSQDYDLWLEDHKPFQFLKHPLVSGIMAVETFLEAAHLLYPHLRVLGVRRLSFEDILECPVDTEREAQIHCRRQTDALQGIRCDVRLSSVDISPSGRRLDRWSTNYQGQVLLGPPTLSLPHWPEFRVTSEELDTRAMEPDEIQDGYTAHTGLKGRYRVLERIHGTGRGVVKGDMLYREQTDMSGLDQVRYQYAPYLLEALMHLIAFYVFLRQEDGGGDLIPASMEEMRFVRRAQKGERFTLEARLRKHDPQGVTWDAHAVDESDTPIMQLAGMRMNRFRR
jgi:malonyl CoA-acyl carrier protein transacylase